MTKKKKMKKSFIYNIQSHVSLSSFNLSDVNGLFSLIQFSMAAFENPVAGTGITLKFFDMSGYLSAFFVL